MPSSTGRPSTASSISSPPAAMRCSSYERYARIRKTKEGLLARLASAHRPAIPAECRHHHRGAGAERALRARTARGTVGARRPGARQDRGGVSWRRWSHGDTFLFAGKVLRFEGIRENECFVSNAPRQGRQGALSMPAASSRSRPISPTQVRGMLADPETLEGAAGAGGGLAAAAGATCPMLPKRERPAGRDLSARRPLLHGGLSLRRPAGAPDARHAADAPAGARWRAAARLRRHRLLARASGRSATWARCSRAASRRSADLFDEDMLGDDLDAWLAESWLLKRTFRNCAVDLRA